MHTIKLNFINRSYDPDNLPIVIFQRNIKEGFGESAVAWKVIKNCGQSDNHPFEFPLNYTISASDSYDNHTPQAIAYDGQSFDVVKSAIGHNLEFSSGPASIHAGIEIRNRLTQDSIIAKCYRGRNLLAVKTGLKPSQEIVFSFTDKIYIDAIPEIEEGDVMDDGVISKFNYQLNLHGIASADIVMTGGGINRTAGPLYFKLENVILR